jgi:hypothetical protein
VSDLIWVKSLENNWLDLNRIDLQTMLRNPSRPQGVYIIWHGGVDPKIVRIGTGDVVKKLIAHRANPQITRYKKNGPLMVTWAAQPDPRRQAGIAKYLTEQFCPLVRDVPLDIPAIAVRSPFA